MISPMARATLLVGMSAIGSAVVQAGPNLIQNGDFERGASPVYPGVGLFWETNDAAPHPEVDALTTDAYSGACAQRLKAHSTWDLGALRQVSAYGSVIPGRTYHAQAWIRTANVQNPAGWYVFGLWWFNGDQRVPGAEGESKMPRQETNNYGWRAISWQVVAPPGANRVAAFLSRHTDGDAWYDEVFIGEVRPGPAVIQAVPASISRRVVRGGSLADEPLTIRNTGGGLLSYAVVDDAVWLAVQSPSGTNAGEVDRSVLRYNLASLGVGRHTARVTVGDQQGGAPSASIPVELLIAQPADFDFDLDVDMSDYSHLQTCYSGSGTAQRDPACGDARLDDDEDVDQDDLECFLRCFTAPNVPAEPDCMLR